MLIPHRLDRRLVAQLVDVLGFVIGQAARLAGDGNQQRAELDALGQPCGGW